MQQFHLLSLSLSLSLKRIVKNHSKLANCSKKVCHRWVTFLGLMELFIKKHKFMIASKINSVNFKNCLPMENFKIQREKTKLTMELRINYQKIIEL